MSKNKKSKIASDKKKTIPELAELYEARGLSETTDLENFLTHNNHYIVGMYASDFKNKYHDKKSKKPDNYKKGTTLQDIQESYYFDLELAQLINKYMIILENSFKAVITTKFIESSKMYYPHLSSKYFVSSRDNNNSSIYRNIVKIYERVISDKQGGGYYAQSIFEETTLKNLKNCGKPKVDINNDIIQECLQHVYKKNSKLLKKTTNKVTIKIKTLDSYKTRLSDDFEDIKSICEELNNVVSNKTPLKVDKKFDIEIFKKAIKKLDEQDELCRLLTLIMYVIYIPLFMVITYLNFLQTLFIYRGIKDDGCKENIAKTYGMTSDDLVKCINYMIHLRNRCAHPTINYKAEDFDSIIDLSEDLKTNIGLENYEDKRIFPHLAILQYFIKIINPPLGLNFKEELKTLIENQEDKEFLKVLQTKQAANKLLKKMGAKSSYKVWSLDLWK